ncbi:MAG TPA: TetR/AcrR family transcriptional regulator [Niastella sp.]
MPKVKQFDEVEVLKKAKDVFTEKGYNGTSMDDLVQATGLSRSSIYDTFGDKHGLFLRTLDQYKTAQLDDLTQLQAKTDSPKKKIRIIFDYTVKDILTDEERKGCMLVNASMEMSCVDKVIAKAALESMEEMEGHLYMLIKEGQAKGEIAKKASPKALARYLYNSLMGLRMVGKSRPDADALREIVKVTLSILDE